MMWKIEILPAVGKRATGAAAATGIAEIETGKESSLCSAFVLH